MRSYKNKGFTLVELVIVIAIIAILAVIAIAYFSSQLSKGKDARRKSDLDRIKIAVEEYEKDHNCYPLALSCTPEGTELQPYLNQIPCDPGTNAPYVYEHEVSMCPSWYRLYAKLDYTQDPLALPFCGPAGNDAFNYYVSSPNAPGCVPITGGSGSGGGGVGGGGGTPTVPPGQFIDTGYYGCKGGTCVPITWDPTRPGPECDPNYQSNDCYGQCSQSRNACKSWK